LLKSVIEAQQWCDKPENRDEVAAICAKRQWINCPVEDVTDRVKGKFDYGVPGKVVENSPHIMRYWADHASYPFQVYDLWFLTEDIRWGKYEAGYDTKGLIAKVNREDLWRDAAKALNLTATDIPASKSRGKETFSTARSSILKIPALTSKSLNIKRVEV
jgi:nitrate/nitrite transport system substrate-binding protein